MTAQTTNIGESTSPSGITDYLLYNQQVAHKKFALYRMIQAIH